MPSGYGYSASAIRVSLTSGPYESAVSMKRIPSSMARLQHVPRFARIRRVAPDAFAGDAHGAEPQARHAQVADRNVNRGGIDPVQASIFGRCV